MAGKTATVSSSSKARDSRRKLIVFSALAGSLTVTALFLQLLSPPPVRATVQNAVLMSGSAEHVTSRLDEPAPRAWKYIYIHHSKSTAPERQLSSSNKDVGDHFVIANGIGAADGKLLVGYRWNTQQIAVAPRGASSVDPDCISICLVGDFDRAQPSAAQVRQLSELVRSLQSKYAIPSQRILTANHPSAAGIGRLFPRADFTQQIAAQ